MEDDVVNHFKQFHPDVEGVVCPHCCKLLSKKCTLNRHIEQVHLGLQIFKPAKCQECGKVFSKKGHLDRHVRTIHMGMKDESEPCPHCGKIFTTKSSLEPHIEAVHKGKYVLITYKYHILFSSSHLIFRLEFLKNSD